ncbi:MAG: (R)-citramalate synthase [Promethearchaeota archaeon CR_4]|nr:MAG: (R)-citramalate synthase [Candidatus Lokiarchaeota archaeon CR_4]
MANAREIEISPIMKIIEAETHPPERVYFFDTTLRDGEQTPGIAFTLEEKLKIAQALDQLGIDVIEAGFPRVSDADFQACKQIPQLGLKSEIIGLARIGKDDINKVIDCDMDSIHVFIATSDLHLRDKLKITREQCLEKIIEGVEYARAHYDIVEFSAEDATRTDLDFLIKVNQTAVKAGASRINIPDTVGTITPRGFAYVIQKNREVLPANVRISTHCHNDFGLAVANSLAGVEMGAGQIHTTILGIGERAGNADCAQCAMGLFAMYGLKTNIKTKLLYPTYKLVESLSGFPISACAPLVGKNAFRHEAGIHAHAIIQNPRSYEPLTPELIGIPRSDKLSDIIDQSIQIGKHSGGHALKAKLESLSIPFTHDQFSEIMNRVKSFGDKGRRIMDEDLMAIVRDVIGSIPEEEKFIFLDELTVLTGSVTPTSTVKMRIKVNGGYDTQIASAVGVGPVDASLKAIMTAFANVKKFDIPRLELMEYQIEAVTGGTDALASVTIKLRDEQKREYEAKAVHEDIVMSSVKAMLNGFNKAMIHKYKKK